MAAAREKPEEIASKHWPVEVLREQGARLPRRRARSARRSGLSVVKTVKIAMDAIIRLDAIAIPGRWSAKKPDFATGLLVLSAME